MGHSAAVRTLARVIGMVGVALTTLVTDSVHAQQRVPSSMVGERVRVTSDGGGARVVGAVASIETGGIELTDSLNASHTFAYDAIDRLERSLGRVSNSGKGFLWGAGVGFGLGLIVGAEFVNAFCSGSITCDNQVQSTIGLAAVAALPAGLLGALIGGASSSERWEVVPIASSQDFGFRVRPPLR
jgi:hypothetical protein